MMSDPNHADAGPVRPQVIDLDAEEISTEADSPRAAGREADGRPGTEDSPPPPRKTRTPLLWLVAALVLGALAGGWLYRDVLASYFPSGEMTAMKARLDALEVNGSGLADQIAAVKQVADGAAEASGTASEAARAAAGQAATVADALASVDSRLGALDQRIAAAEEALGVARADIDQFRKSMSVAATPAAPGAPVDTAALAALGQRIDALEKDVASLKSAGQAADGSTASLATALSQALSDLKAKVAAGAPYGDDFERIARMVPAAAGLDTVGARAGEGLPNAAGLAQELRDAIPALPQPAAAAAADDGYLGSLMKSLSGVVSIRAIGEADWPAVAGRAASFAEAGDLDQAIAVIDAAEGERPMAITQWRERAAARRQLEAALSQVSEAVLRQIAAIGGPAQ